MERKGMLPDYLKEESNEVFFILLL